MAQYKFGDRNGSELAFEFNNGLADNVDLVHQLFWFDLCCRQITSHLAAAAGFACRCFGFCGTGFACRCSGCRSGGFGRQTLLAGRQHRLFFCGTGFACSGCRCGGCAGATCGCCFNFCTTCGCCFCGCTSHFDLQLKNRLPMKTQNWDFNSAETNRELQLLFTVFVQALCLRPLQRRTWHLRQEVSSKAGRIVAATTC